MRDSEYGVLILLTLKYALSLAMQGHEGNTAGKQKIIFLSTILPALHKL